MSQSVHGTWANRWLFILAATGSAVGLGNIWKFPYITGENGGGAFVLIYLLCIALVGIPVMVAEVMLGRMGRQSPINTMLGLVRRFNSPEPEFWSLIGWMGALAGFLILSFYSVIAGWAIAYIPKLALGDFQQATGEYASATFGALLADPFTLTLWHSLFMLATIAVVARGVNKGLETAIKWMMPLLFLLLVVLLVYAMQTDSFAQGFQFLFSFDFSKLNSESIVIALGHSFFTLSLGLGAIMAYGAYMPEDVSIGKTIVAVALLDTLVALASGMVIFPIVFSNGLEPGAGPGLLFQTLPIAFGNMGWGSFFGVLFFVLVVFAALTSSISLAEPIVAWLVESKGWSRIRAGIWVGGAAWLLGIGTVLSFNEWSGYTLLGKTFFDCLDFLTTNIMLPLGGLLIAVFVGWVLSRETVRGELRMGSANLYNAWRFILMFISPLAVLAVLVNGLL